MYIQAFLIFLSIHNAVGKLKKKKEMHSLVLSFRIKTA